MRNALIENGVVANIIELNPANASEFPTAIPIVDVSVEIGDIYTDGVFWRNNVRLLTPLQTAEATIAALDEAMLELELANAMMALGM